MVTVHLYNVKREYRLIRHVPHILIIAALIAAFIYGISGMPGTASAENLAMTERAIHSALVNCYAIEGFYPLSLSYLEEHYGLRVDYEKYVVMYSALGSNVMPSVRIVMLDDGAEIN